MSVQFGAAVATKAFDRVGASGTSLLRLAFAALILVVWMRPHPRRFTREQLQVAGLLGLALGLMNTCFYEALDRIPLGIAVTIEFAGPLSVGIFASHRRSDVGWALLAAAGIVLLGGGGKVDTAGLVLILLAGAFWAAYILLTQRAGRMFRGSEGLALASVVAIVAPLGPGLHAGGSELLQPELLAVGAFVALMSSVIPYSLDMAALRRLPANVFGVLMSLEPAIAALAGLLLLGQSLTLREWVAIALVVAASVGITRASA